MCLAVLLPVSVTVFSLFHPKTLEAAPPRGHQIVVHTAGRDVALEWPHRMRFRLAGSPRATITGMDGGACDFVLSVPGRITRAYRGTGEVLTDGGELVAVVHMDTEIAVASIVAAESPPGAPMNALEAQAVVARSYLLAAGKRHKHSDFCDTTHCQFLRSPPPPDSQFSRAAGATRGLVLVYNGRPIEALYSANCGGRTRTLEQAGLTARGYPYFAVRCIAGGSPSGHRVGLCQEGAALMAKQGAGWRQILNHYFPGAGIESR
jgi:peptidoglycan hydrolase-like amidase